MTFPAIAPRLAASLAASALVAPLIFLGACGDPSAEEVPTEQRTTATIPQPAFSSVTDTMIAAGTGADWPTHGGNLANHRFSPLDQIDAGSVSELVPVWVHSTGIEGALETTPIVVGNTMYVTTAGGRVLALNAATGEELWQFDPGVEVATLCCGPINKGVSVYGDRVYVASLDARLIALDARTGQPVWQTQLADPTRGFSATMAPLAVQGRVYLGVSGERYGIRGFLAAFDAQSGEEIWRWYTIPSPEQGGWWGAWKETDPFGTPLNRDIQAELADSSATSGSWGVGGGGIANTPAYDPDSGRLYVNVEGPAPLMNGGIRPGDNLYTGSIVALDAATGRMVWHAQYLPHDSWGLSGGSPPFLFDRGGDRYVGFAGRTGWIYVFDADDGSPILRSDNFVPQEALFRRPGEGAVRVAPGANGGNPGTGVGYDSRSGVAYVGGVHQPMVYARQGGGYAPGQLWLGGALMLPPGEEQWGTVTAIDLADGRIRWQRQTPAPVHSDVLVTAGSLVFVGQGSGSLDAFHSGTGELLWQFQTGAGVHGGPITYQVGDVQYVVAAAGGSFHFGTSAGDELLAFALASRRPEKAVSDYGTPEYERSGPAAPAPPQTRQERAPADTTARPAAEPTPQRGTVTTPQTRRDPTPQPTPQPTPVTPQQPRPDTTPRPVLDTTPQPASDTSGGGVDSGEPRR